MREEMQEILQGFDYVDMRAEFEELAREATPKIGKPRAEQGVFARKQSLTWHYFGDGFVSTAPGRELTNIKQYPLWHMQRIQSLNGRETCDGVQYHVAVLSTGQIIWLRDFERVLWHCANYQGNLSSLAIHLPVGYANGVDQTPTTAQLEVLKRFSDAAAKYYGFTRKNYFGHREWSANRCPGEYIFSKLKAFRAEPVLSDPTLPVVKKKAIYRVTAELGLRVRTSYSSTSPQAKRGSTLLRKSSGEEIEIGALVTGESIDGNASWGWQTNGEGFLAARYLEYVKGDILVPERPS